MANLPGSVDILRHLSAPPVLWRFTNPQQVSDGRPRRLRLPVTRYLFGASAGFSLSSKACAPATLLRQFDFYRLKDCSRRWVSFQRNFAGWLNRSTACWLSFFQQCMNGDVASWSLTIICALLHLMRK
ncbi:hypothetical protein KCP73_15785 [Salmonella enterica subsp. enterica]|nr:hypothetical protein KCP73_15785 [Salmonella enterica subsp. enterica]